MKLLKHDIDAIARIVDRCAAGGADNRNGGRYVTRQTFCRCLINFIKKENKNETA